MDGRIIADLFTTSHAQRVVQKTILPGTNQAQVTVSVVDISKEQREPERMVEVYRRAYRTWEDQGALVGQKRKMWYDPLLMTLFLENTLP